MDNNKSKKTRVIDVTPKSFSQLNEIFDVDDAVMIPYTNKEIKGDPAFEEDEITPDEDLKFVKNRLRNLVLIGDDILQTTMAEAKSSNSPEMFELALGAMKTQTAIMSKLISVNNGKRTKEEKTNTVNNNNMIVFNGSSKDIINQLREAQDDKKIEK